MENCGEVEKGKKRERRQVACDELKIRPPCDPDKTATAFAAP